MQKVIGVGGVFFKAKDPKKLMEWYTGNLGINFEPGFFEFKWDEEPKNKEAGSTVFRICKEDDAEFTPSEKNFMINFRVADLKSLHAELKQKGATVSDDIQEYDFGKFGWVMDPDGNKIQLWEPANKPTA